MPDRVIDAPIPDEELAQRLIRNTKGWMQERIAQLESLIESGDNPDGALIYRSDHDKIVARLEAEKQEAHTDGWNACVKKMAELCLEWVNSVSCEPGTACKCQRTADAIRQRALDWSKPTAAKQGDE